MTTLEMLHAIEEAKVIYEIAYRNAGVGFVFYEGKHDEVGAPSPLEGDGWRKGLTVESYHDSFEEAVAAEYARLPVEGGMNAPHDCCFTLSDEDHAPDCALKIGNLGSKVHRAWHGFWAIVWSHLRWDSRAAQHIDAWLVLGMDELSLHVMEPNRDRVGCRLVPIDDPDGYYHWLEHGV